MAWWNDIEARRARLDHLSRAEMARRAGISESTVTKGLNRGTRPIGAVRKAIERVLDEAEAEARGNAA